MTGKASLRFGATYLGRLGRLLVRHTELLEMGHSDDVEPLLRRIRALADRWVRFRSRPRERLAQPSDVLDSPS